MGNMAEDLRKIKAILRERDDRLKFNCVVINKPLDKDKFTAYYNIARLACSLKIERKKFQLAKGRTNRI